MRIALIAPPWLPVPPPAYGGTELVIDLLARGLHEAGHDLTLYTVGASTCPVPSRHLYDQGRWNGDGGSSVHLELSHAVWAYRSIGDVDVVHDHTMVGPFVASHLDVPCVVTTNHGPFRSSDLGRIYRVLPPKVAVIAISHDQASAHDGPIAAVIHHGVDVESYIDDADVGDHLLFLGRMTPDKAPHLAIEVARRAGRRLVIAAKMREPTEHAYFAHVVRPLLGDDVEYVGEAGPIEKRELLASAVALVNPIQWSEPFGLVMAEALASGTPVISTPCGAASEIVDQGVTGFLCEDVDEMVAAVHAVEDLDRAACRRAAETRFSIDRMVRDHVRLYEELARPARPAVRRSPSPGTHGPGSAAERVVA